MPGMVWYGVVRELKVFGDSVWRGTVWTDMAMYAVMHGRARHDRKIYGMSCGKVWYVTACD